MMKASPLRHTHHLKSKNHAATFTEALKGGKLASFVTIGLVFGLAGYIIGSRSGASSCKSLKLTDRTHFLFTSDPEGSTAREVSLVRNSACDQTGKCFPSCPKNFTEYIPSHRTSNVYPKVWGQWLERNFPSERHQCIVPPPQNYKLPVRWPDSRDYIWLSNVPDPKKLADIKAEQHWLEIKGDRIYFPGGGTHFKGGADEYINRLANIIPIRGGAIRTVFDVGCGVASFSAALLPLGILTMSVAPRDVHENQMQMVLERGLPGMLGFLNRYRLPYPSQSFDMAHCSRCRIDWHEREDMLLIEILRLLRPGGYFVWSSPPVYRNDQESRDLWNRTMEVMQRLCFKEVGRQAETAVFQKPQSNECWLSRGPGTLPHLCSNGTDPDAAWNVTLERCVTPVADLKGIVPIWPERINTGLRLGRPNATALLCADTAKWSKRLMRYKKLIDFSRIRNIMDARAGWGSFAASLIDLPVWVMNIMPLADLHKSSLKVVYDRGFIGTVHNWCEDFSSYPRTYDLIHAAGLFTLKHACSAVDILFEFDRLLRPLGYVIVRDSSANVAKVVQVATQLRWDCQTVAPSERVGSEQLLFCQKLFSPVKNAGNSDGLKL
eukprot:jgi/Mesen1/6837/ME000351S05955